MRFNSLWLYTLLTAAVTVVSCQGFAETAAMDPMKAIEACKAIYGTTITGDALNSCVNQKQGGSVTADPSSCSSLQATYLKEDAELKTSCNEANLSGTKCDQAVYTCNECNASEDGIGGGADCNSLVPDENVPTYKSEASSDLSQYNLAGASNYRVKKDRDNDRFYQFAICPSAAINDIKQLKEELADLKKDAKELKENITQKQLDIQKVEGDITTAEQTYQDKVAEKKAEFEAKQEDMEGELSQKTKDLNEKMSQQQNELTGLMNSRDTLTAKYTEQIAAIENVCEAEAERELTKRREDYVKQLSNSNAKQTSINSLLKLRLKGRNTDDEEFRKRAILRCQQNPARYQKPVQLLNNQYLLNKRDLETAISQKQTSIQQTQQELIKADPENQAKLQKIVTRYNEQLQLLLNTKNTTIGNCGTAPAAMGANQTQNGASGCTGLMAQKNIEQQTLQRYNSELTEKQDDLAYTQQLFDAAQKATNGNEGGHSSPEGISTAGSGVMSLLPNLIKACASNPSAVGEYKKRFRTFYGKDYDDGPQNPPAPDPAAISRASAAGNVPILNSGTPAPAARPQPATGTGSSTPPVK